MEHQLKVAVFFGGVSSEHEVSCVSASTVRSGLEQAGCQVTAVGITKQGDWYYFPGSAEAMADGSWEQDPACVPCVLSTSRSKKGLWLLGETPRFIPLDAAVPAMHGRNGEDGTIQGLFELAGLPYVGCGVLSSAVCMDKAVANTLLDAAGVPRCEWTWASRRECQADPAALADRVSGKLGWPVFVKPANAGSSVGISKAANKEELIRAMEVALHEDDKVVFERFVEGQEVECAVLGNDELLSTQPGEILAGAEFYTYDDKYKNGVSRTLIPANLSQEKLEEVRRNAEAAYRALGCQGLSRCDFFVEKGTGKVLCNELNTLPGFTAISMYPKLMESVGLDLPTLCLRLIKLAMERKGPYHG